MLETLLATRQPRSTKGAAAGCRRLFHYFCSTNRPSGKDIFFSPDLFPNTGMSFIVSQLSDSKNKLLMFSVEDSLQLRSVLATHDRTLCH